jgi:hypothetical protein
VVGMGRGDVVVSVHDADNYTPAGYIPSLDHTTRNW